jgi:hypothetical protein
MRTLVLVPVLALALTSLGAETKPAADRSGTFHVVVDTIEGCSCPLFCACYFNMEPADPHMCQFNNVYKFRKGSHYGDVDLSDATVWMSGDLGGEWGKSAKMPTEWVSVTMDRKVSPLQRKAIEVVLAKVFPVEWKKQEMRDDDIEWNQGPAGSSAKLKSGRAEIELTPWKGPNAKEPTVLKNVQYWGSSSNEGFVLAKSNHRFDGGVKFSHKEKNGFTIRWTAEGKAAPLTPTTKAGKP